MKYYKKLIFFLLFLIISKAAAQSEVKDYPILSEEDFFARIPNSFQEAQQIKLIYRNGERENAIQLLTAYFKEKASQRFFFDWKNLAQRMDDYNSIYPSAAKSHLKDAESHTSTFEANTSWKLPFVNKAGNEMNAYAIRHLFRQHKAGDLAFSYYLSDRQEFLPYFTDHVASLMAAYEREEVESIDDGNGAYEAFRGGNRMENWILTHHLFLGSEDYSAAEQLMTMRTFLHTAEVLYQTNQSFNYGNHQTKGMVALAVIAMMYPEFDTDKKYYDFAIANLGEHLTKEVNPDGFQFERSFHYHVGDIDNYLRVFKLAQITKNDVPDAWSSQLKNMFSAMKNIALPNKYAPVIQDDTDQPMATQNQLDEIMALGYTLFQEPEFGYFSADHPSEEYYWLLSQKDLNLLSSKKSSRPSVKSTALESTGYYVFREGWKENDQYMLISTGVSEQKPDHQHGDVLGFQLFANGEMLMPNYQVRYPLPEFQFFKNSWVKNVALVDSIPQGQEWTGNQGGSGFGKFQSLPEATVTLWEPKGEIQAFRASHDGYTDLNVNYHRVIYYFPGEFWFVKDEFTGISAHTFYQNFQGNYSLEDAPTIARSNQADASGMDIIQLAKQIQATQTGGDKGKNRITYQSAESAAHTFATIIRPYEKYEDRTALPQDNDGFSLGNWQVNLSQITVENNRYTSDYILVKDDLTFLIGMTEMTIGSHTYTSNQPVDLFLKKVADGIEIKCFSDVDALLTTKEEVITIESLQTLTLNPTND